MNKLCCNVKTLISCQLCNTRWCGYCWEIGGHRGHYEAGNGYFCSKHPGKDVALLTGKGEDYLSKDNLSWQADNFLIIPHREGYVKTPRRPPWTSAA